MKLRILVKPNAKETKSLGRVDDAYIITLHAQPKEGEANDELTRFLSKTLRIPKTFVVLAKGTTSRYKTVELPDGTDLSPLNT